MNKPLEGLFVVELTTYWAAPSAGEFLRCLGARVVKIETGKAGDSVRYWGRTCGMPIEANENPSFDLFNGGKEFMHMDLNDPEHERVLHNMLAKADVFLTSMRLGGLKKHNLDYDTLKEKYPRLVMAHATGYGCKDGPLSAAPGLDAVAFFAMNGLISDLRLNPDDSPICPPTGMGDLTTGMPLFGAIMTALFARERTGKGDYVSASLYGTGNWVTSAINSGTQYFNPWPRSRFTQSPMGQAFETKDGKFVQIFVNEYERYFPVFCKAFNIEDMLDDERVNTRPALNVNGNCAIIVARCIEEAKKKDRRRDHERAPGRQRALHRAARHRRQVQRAGAARPVPVQRLPRRGHLRERQALLSAADPDLHGERRRAELLRTEQIHRRGQRRAVRGIQQVSRSLPDDRPKGCRTAPLFANQQSAPVPGTEKWKCGGF